MSKINAMRGIRQILMSDYGHYSRQEERKMFDAILLQPNFKPPTFATNYDNHLLAEQPQRSIKNNLICGVAVFCRHAADLGADDERCYALSDYYIREIENMPNVKNWQESSVELFFDIIHSYATLVAESRKKNYSLPISRTIRYVQQHLYDKFTVGDIAEEVGVHPNYLSSRFRREVGNPLREYIRNQKMEEAKRLLQDTNHSITEISEMLGYCNVSYFAKLFRQVHNCNPSEFLGYP